MERKGERIFLSIKLRLLSNLCNRAFKSSGIGVNLGKQKQNTMTIEEFKAELVARFPWQDDKNYMAVDGDGEVWQYEFEPIMSIDHWHNSSGIAKAKGRIGIPDGIDWRDLLIDRNKASDEQQ